MGPFLNYHSQLHWCKWGKKPFSCIPMNIIKNYIPAMFFLNLVNYVKSLFKDAFTRLGLFKQPPPEEDDHTGDGYVLSTDSRTGFGDEVMKKDRVCSVCLEAMEKRDEMRELCKCSHVFHRECIDGWVKEGRLTCPLCRSALYPDPMDFGRPDPRNSFLDCDVIY
ncbi:hypothetical protein E1A91_A09G199300v1 [Gossypium mustelinum]|uniref:RING-type domain-containing protein n=1 Tax=Gossypium mustelinum TaxID=34275 RepID=A0A5D2Y3B7_GOSMU|nr:hypothetical protein E1A91_A09G199300v1 [Gossypium mustelinum]